MPTNQNKNSNTQNNNNKQIVHVTVNTAPPRRKRAPAKPRETDARSPAPPVNVYSPSVYVPHQSTSVGGAMEPPEIFNTATTNRDAYLRSLAQNQIRHNAHQTFMENYAQASVPGLRAGIPNQTTSLTPDNVSVSSRHSIHQPESEHLATPRATKKENFDINQNPFDTLTNPLYNTTPSTPLHEKFDDAGPSSPAAAQEEKTPFKLVHGVHKDLYNEIVDTRAGSKRSKQYSEALRKIGDSMNIEYAHSKKSHLLHTEIRNKHKSGKIPADD